MISPFFNDLLFIHHRPAQMGIHTEQTQPMIDDNSVAKYAQCSRKEYIPVVGRGNRGMCHRCQINTEVYLAIDNLTVISVVTVITKAGHSGRLWQAHKGSLPVKVFGAAISKLKPFLGSCLVAAHCLPAQISLSTGSVLVEHLRSLTTAFSV